MIKVEKKCSRAGIDAASTLVEVTLAIGVLATVMVSLMGLLTSGFSSMKKAADIATEARIVQQLLGELQSIEWNRIDQSLESNNFRTRYFDDQGIDTIRGNQVYTARIYSDQAPSSSGSEFSLPGDVSNRIDRRADLRRFIIRITHVPGPPGEALLENPEKSGFYHDFSGTVIRLRKSQPEAPQD